MEIIKYIVPNNWIKYNLAEISENLINAKAAVNTLQNIPYEKGWIEGMQQMELKREIAGTSKIEGADFTDNELEEALKESPEELFTRSQRQARAAKETYLWIANLPDDQPINKKLICEIHKRIVTGADDDHCEPGQTRKEGHNVTFGNPRHRGAEGGSGCQKGLENLIKGMSEEYNEHDPLIQALTTHYHFAAMHPFGDGNGRTARALEALMLQRAGLRNICFIAMSNYYYDEKTNYLASLALVRRQNHNLTSFLNFALKGIETQTKRVMAGLRREISKALFRNMMYDLFGRLKTPRKRVIAKRQVEIQKILLREDSVFLDDLLVRTENLYHELAKPVEAQYRDLNYLISLGAIMYRKDSHERYIIMPNLDWPTQITHTDFMEKIRNMPKAKGHLFSRE